MKIKNNAMKQENKNPVGRPKGTKKNVIFWCDPKDKPVIKEFIRTLDDEKQL